MNKFFKNFSKYLLIASLGFASTQATDRKKRTKETEKIKKLDKIILKEKIVMVGGIFIAIFQGLVFCLAISVWKNRKKLPFRNSINLGTTNDLLSDALPQQSGDGGFVSVGNDLISNISSDGGGEIPELKLEQQALKRLEKQKLDQIKAQQRTQDQINRDQERGLGQKLAQKKLALEQEKRIQEKRIQEIKRQVKEIDEQITGNNVDLIGYQLLIPIPQSLSVEEAQIRPEKRKIMIEEITNQILALEKNTSREIKLREQILYYKKLEKKDLQDPLWKDKQQKEREEKKEEIEEEEKEEEENNTISINNLKKLPINNLIRYISYNKIFKTKKDEKHTQITVNLENKDLKDIDNIAKLPENALLYKNHLIQEVEKKGIQELKIPKEIKLKKVNKTKYSYTIPSGNLTYYFEKLNEANVEKWENYAKLQYEYFDRDFDKCVRTVFTNGLRAFKESIRSYRTINDENLRKERGLSKSLKVDDDIWVAYAVNNKIPKNEKKENSNEELDAEDKIEMVLTVITSEESYVAMHMGISRSYNFHKCPPRISFMANLTYELKNNGKKYRGRGYLTADYSTKSLSGDLHTFSAKVINSYYDKKKEYLVTKPTKIMREIMTNTIGEDLLWRGDSAERKERDKDSRFISNTWLNKNSILDIPEDIHNLMYDENSITADEIFHDPTRNFFKLTLLNGKEAKSPIPYTYMIHEYLRDTIPKYKRDNRKVEKDIKESEISSILNSVIVPYIALESRDITRT